MPGHARSTRLRASWLRIDAHAPHDGSGGVRGEFVAAAIVGLHELCGPIQEQLAGAPDDEEDAAVAHERRGVRPRRTTGARTRARGPRDVEPGAAWIAGRRS